MDVPTWAVGILSALAGGTFAFKIRIRPKLIVEKTEDGIEDRVEKQLMKNLGPVSSLWINAGATRMTQI